VEFQKINLNIFIMRTITITLLILLSIVAYSQKKVKVTEGSEKFSVGRVDVMVANIYEADKKYVEKAWKKLMKRYSGKVTSKSEIVATDVIIKRMMGDKRVDVYAIVKDGPDGTVLISVAMDLGGAFLSKSSHPEKYKEAKAILKDFAVEVSKEAVREQINDQEKILGKFQNEQEKLEKENENLKKSIEDYKQKIKDAEQAIVENGKAQEQKKKEVEDQRKIVIGLSEKERAIE
jgi:predicted RNase H-like nuclease (RuvC/YqgF family)